MMSTTPQPQLKTRFEMPGTDGFAIKGMGNETVSLAISHGKKHGLPVILEGFEIPRTDKKNNLITGEGAGVDIIPINLRTSNKWHTQKNLKPHPQPKIISNDKATE